MSAAKCIDGASPDSQAEPGFEDALRRLEEIVGELEGGSLSLDKSLALYEEGISAYKICSRLLQDAEGKVAKLVESLAGELTEQEIDVPVDAAGTQNAQ